MPTLRGDRRGVGAGSVGVEGKTADGRNAAADAISDFLPDTAAQPAHPASLAGLDAALDAFRAQAGHAQPPELIRAELIGLRLLIDQLELEFSSRVSRLAQCDELAWEGHPSATEWVRHQCRTTGTAANNALAVGEQSARLEASRHALLGGQIGFAHLALIAQTADWVQQRGADAAVAFDEGFLLAKAREESVSELRRECAHVRHACDPRCFLREQLDQVEARFLELKGGEGGGVFLRGYLDGEGGALLRTALDPLARPLPEDERTRVRRLADALVELCGHALDGGRLPQHAGQRPHLQVTVTLPTLRGDGGAPAAELEGGAAIAAETARRLGCDAQVRRVVFGPKSAVIDVGRAARVPQAATRQAVIARDRGCVWPGCGRPASWGEIHHLRHWAHGGATDLENLAVVCRAHHFKLHEGGWKLIRSDGAHIAVAPVPNGVFTQRPAVGPSPAPPPWRDGDGQGSGVTAGTLAAARMAAIEPSPLIPGRSAVDLAFREPALAPLQSGSQIRRPRIPEELPESSEARVEAAIELFRPWATAGREQCGRPPSVPP